MVDLLLIVTAHVS